ncbi:MAG: response regulator [Anaerolineae bacterium]|nr:response regulator [Anaerolineae bacterium]
MSGKRILVVDNAPEVRIFLADVLLRAEGYDTFTAADGQEGYERALDVHPDLIIADYSMPHKTGLEMFLALRQAGHDIPTILVTAEGSEALAVQCLRLGLSDYLRKPFAVDDVLQAIHRALDSQPPPPAEPLKPLVDLLGAANAAIIAVDTHGRLIFSNTTAYRLFGSEGRPLLAGRLLDEVITHTEVIDLFAKAGGHNRGALTEITLHDGTMTLNARVTTLPGTGQLAVLHDITHLKELDRTRSEFVQHVSQDIRSPLTTILGYVELLERVGTLNEQQRKFTERITFSVQSITALLSDLLNLGRVEAGFDADREPTQLPLIVRYAVEGNHQQIADKHLNLVLSLPEQIPPVLGNPLHLRQLIQNLLDNAILYTPEGGMVRVGLEAEGSFVVLRIVDTGIGIPPDEQIRVFDKFYRASNVQAQSDGTGLGLSIVKSIVEGHGGRIWMESEPGSGTAFSIMLPAYREKTAPVASATSD